MEKETVILDLTKTEIKKLRVIDKREKCSVDELVQKWLEEFIEEKERERI